MKENNIGISSVLTTKMLTDAFQALLLNNRYCVMRTSSPSTTSIIQQSINAPVSFTKVLEILRKPSAENLFYAEVHPRLEPKGQKSRKTLRQILFTKFRSTDFRVISISFVKGWQTLSRVIGFIWNAGGKACFQYSVTDKDYKYL